MATIKTGTHGPISTASRSTSGPWRPPTARAATGSCPRCRRVLFGTGPLVTASPDPVAYKGGGSYFDFKPRARARDPVRGLHPVGQGHPGLRPSSLQPAETLKGGNMHVGLNPNNGYSQTFDNSYVTRYKLTYGSNRVRSVRRPWQVPPVPAPCHAREASLMWAAGRSRPRHSSGAATSVGGVACTQAGSVPGVSRCGATVQGHSFDAGVLLSPSGRERLHLRCILCLSSTRVTLRRVMSGLMDDHFDDTGGAACLSRADLGAKRAAIGTPEATPRSNGTEPPAWGFAMRVRPCAASLHIS